MAAVNTRARNTARTHEGAPAVPSKPAQQLRRALMTCMLWEDSFYEDGVSIADRITALVPHIEPDVCAQIAMDARTSMKIRHAPLLVACEMAKHAPHRPLVASVLETIIDRADEITELLAIWWKDGAGDKRKAKSKVLPHCITRGLARAFTKFNEYQLAKYDRKNAVRLRDALFLCHAKPKDAEQDALWKRLINNQLQTPDTWEVTLSAGGDKKAHWTRLLAEQKLGGLALIRNLRNMLEADVDIGAIRGALETMKVDKVLPFRFIAAARHAPRLEAELEQAMLRSLAEMPRLTGETVLLIDVSGSMKAMLSAKSEINRIDAACGLAMLLRETARCRVFTFSEKVVEIPARRGFALRDAIDQSQPKSGTYLGKAVEAMRHLVHDRLIVVTDEQSHDVVGAPAKLARGYMINVAPHQNGVGYGEWTRISGWSDAVIDFIRELESEPAAAE